MSSTTVETVTSRKGRSYEALVIKKNEGDKFPINLGIDRARLILRHLDEIKKFVQERPY